MTRILFGCVWAVVFSVVACMVVGAIAGANAGAQTRTPQEAQAAAARAAASAVGENLLTIRIGSVVVALLGTLFGILPGTGRREGLHDRVMNRRYDPHRYATRLAVLSGVAVMLAVVAGLIYNEWSQTQATSSLNTERFGAIRVGMSEAEVEAALGLPPGDYSGGGEPTITFTRHSDHQTWLGPEQALTVFFDSTGRVTELRVYPVYRPAPAAPRRGR